MRSIIPGIFFSKSCLFKHRVLQAEAGGSEGRSTFSFMISGLYCTASPHCCMSSAVGRSLWARVVMCSLAPPRTSARKSSTNCFLAVLSAKTPSESAQLCPGCVFVGCSDQQTAEQHPRTGPVPLRGQREKATSVSHLVSHKGCAVSLLLPCRNSPSCTLHLSPKFLPYRFKVLAQPHAPHHQEDSLFSSTYFQVHPPPMHTPSSPRPQRLPQHHHLPVFPIRMQKGACWVALLAGGS